MFDLSNQNYDSCFWQDVRKITIRIVTKPSQNGFGSEDYIYRLVRSSMNTKMLRDYKALVYFQK